MNRSTTKIIAAAALAGVTLCLAGCKCHCPKRTALIDEGGLPWDPYEDGKTDPIVKITVRPRDPLNPSPSYGTLGVPVTSFTSGGSSGCFPSSQGWNKYYVTFYFLGPNVSPLPNPNNYPNPDNVNSVTIDTEDPANGSTLDTGIIIMDNLNPNSKICNDDDPAYTANPKLSKATFTPTGTNRKYRLTIFYKSTTAAGINNIVINWHYP